MIYPKRVTINNLDRWHVYAMDMVETEFDNDDLGAICSCGYVKITNCWIAVRFNSCEKGTSL